MLVPFLLIAYVMFYLVVVFKGRKWPLDSNFKDYILHWLISLGYILVPLIIGLFALACYSVFKGSAISINGEGDMFESVVYEYENAASVLSIIIAILSFLVFYSFTIGRAERERGL